MVWLQDPDFTLETKHWQQLFIQQKSKTNVINITTDCMCLYYANMAEYWNWQFCKCINNSRSDLHLHKVLLVYIQICTKKGRATDQNKPIYAHLYG